MKCVKVLKYLLVLLTLTSLVSCAWYRGPTPMPKENADGTALSEFYSGPTMPQGTMDNGGNYDITSSGYYYE